MVYTILFESIPVKCEKLPMLQVAQEKKKG